VEPSPPAHHVGNSHFPPPRHRPVKCGAAPEMQVSRTSTAMYPYRLKHLQHVEEQHVEELSSSCTSSSMSRAFVLLRPPVLVSFIQVSQMLLEGNKTNLLSSVVEWFVSRCSALGSGFKSRCGPTFLAFFALPLCVLFCAFFLHSLHTFF
jgi:hypothetical protein